MLPKNSYSRYYFKSTIFKKAQKVTKYLDYFWKKICHRDFSKIAQSGHTGGTLVDLGAHHISVDPSAHDILRPGFESHAQQLQFFNLHVIELWCEKDKNKNKKRLRLAHWRN